VVSSLVADKVFVLKVALTWLTVAKITHVTCRAGGRANTAGHGGPGVGNLGLGCGLPSKNATGLRRMAKGNDGPARWQFGPCGGGKVSGGVVVSDGSAVDTEVVVAESNIGAFLPHHLLFGG
jgi:hypothetical protein